MSEFGPSFSRELIRSLPELLEGGPDAVLASPGATRAIESDPQARRVITGVARAVTLLQRSRGTRRIYRRESVGTPERAIADAATYFNAELADVLFDVGLARFETLMSGADYFSGFSASDHTDAEARLSSLPPLAENAEQASSLARYIGLVREGDNPESMLDQLFQAVISLVRHSGGAKYYLLLREETSSPTFKPRQWEDLARNESDIVGCAAFALDAAARRWAAQGRVDRASTLSRFVEPYLQHDSGYCYCALSYAARAGDPRLPVAVDRLNAFAASSRELGGITTMFRADQEAVWLPLREKQRHVYAELARRLHPMMISSLAGEQTDD